MRILWFALLLFTACAPAVDPTDMNDSAVVGGQNALEVDRYEKSIVSIWYPDKYSECTGTYIGNGFVLTAAHCDLALEQPYICFSHIAPREIKFRKELSKYCVRAKDSIAHRHYIGAEKMEYNTLNAHDMRLIKLAGKPPVDITPMALPSAGLRLKPQQSVTLSGFGLMSMSPNTVPAALQIADIKFVSRYSQTEFYFDIFKGRTACHGDSGGPVYLKENGKPTLLAVVSRSSVPWAKHTCREAFIATDVIPYLPWIKSAIKVLEAKE